MTDPADVPQVKALARYQTITELVARCNQGTLPFSGPHSLCFELHRRGFMQGAIHDRLLRRNGKVSKGFRQS
jgi:hypothetical protein